MALICKFLFADSKMRVLILLALLGTAFAAPKSESRIVGGAPTTVDNYPFMSNMQYLINGVWWLQWCGGSLLTSTIVLSAAHCFIGDPPSVWRVRLGSTFASTSGTLYNVREFVLHPDYNNPSLDSDIAIVRLATRAAFSRYVQAARIPGTTYVVPDDAIVTALGWGTLYEGGISPEQLQRVDLNVINQEECIARYAFLKTQPGYEHYPDISNGMLCAGILDVGGKDACQGDSGGPLVYERDIVVGVTSWGYGCADDTYPGVWARVSFYSNWVVENANE